MYVVKISVSGGESFEVFLCGNTEQFKALVVEDLWERIQQMNGCYNSADYHMCFGSSSLFQGDSLYAIGIRNGSEISLRYKNLSGSSSGRSNSMDRLADFVKCVLQ